MSANHISQRRNLHKDHISNFKFQVCPSLVCIGFLSVLGRSYPSSNQFNPLGCVPYHVGLNYKLIRRLPTNMLVACTASHTKLQMVPSLCWLDSYYYKQTLQEEGGLPKYHRSREYKASRDLLALYSPFRFGHPSGGDRLYLDSIMYPSLLANYSRTG